MTSGSIRSEIKTGFTLQGIEHPGQRAGPTRQSCLQPRSGAWRPVSADEDFPSRQYRASAASEARASGCKNADRWQIVTSVNDRCATPRRTARNFDLQSDAGLFAGRHSVCPRSLLTDLYPVPLAIFQQTLSSQRGCAAELKSNGICRWKARQFVQPLPRSNHSRRHSSNFPVFDLRSGTNNPGNHNPQVASGQQLAIHRWKSKRRGGDSNPRSPCGDTAFPVLHNRPLCHLSGRWKRGASIDSSVSKPVRFAIRAVSYSAAPSPASTSARC